MSLASLAGRAPTGVLTEALRYSTRFAFAREAHATIHWGNRLGFKYSAGGGSETRGMLRTYKAGLNVASSLLMLASGNGGEAHVTHTAVASDIFPCCAAYGLFAARTLHARRYSCRKWPQLRNLAGGLLAATCRQPFSRILRSWLSMSRRSAVAVLRHGELVRLHPSHIV